MYQKSSIRTAFSLLRWVIVVLFLVAPRVVGHRHIDVMGGEADIAALASHLDRCHSSCRFPVDDHELHYHFSFSVLPHETSAGSIVECRALSLGETGVASRGMLTQSTCLHDIALFGDSSEFQKKSLASGTNLFSNNRFKRIYLGVWII